MTVVFWVCFALVFYTYLGYPLCLALLARLRPRGVVKRSWQPRVSVVLAACNEEDKIRRRLENLLTQDYPAELLEIVLVSDGSSDATVEAAQGLNDPRLKLVVFGRRQGKAAALNAGVGQASGEVVVFCDARQRFEPDTVAQLVANLADPRVGCVSGELMLHRSTAGGIQAEMGAYWRYEKWIRRAESASGSVVGATGAVYAIRRSLYRELPPGTLLDDVMTPMHVVLQGYRTVFDSGALAHDITSEQVAQEWVRKVRTLAGNWQLMSFLPVLLSPLKNPCFWRFISHKVLRLIVPLALLLLLCTGALLPGMLYRGFTGVQLCFYLLAGLGGLAPATRSSRIVNLSYFFLVMNLVAVAGFWRWYNDDSDNLWQPAYVKGDK